MSLLTYLVPLICGEFDFGIIFESVLLIAKNYMSKYDENRAKRYIICSMVAIGWILIYDFILLGLSIKDIVDLVFL